jgi:hypothetical protein
MLRKAIRLFWNCHIADRFSVVLDLSNKHNLVACLRIDSKIVELVNDIHLHFSVSVTVEGIVDLVTKDLVIE